MDSHLAPQSPHFTLQSKDKNICSYYLTGQLHKDQMKNNMKMLSKV